MSSGCIPALGTRLQNVGTTAPATKLLDETLK